MIRVHVSSEAIEAAKEESILSGVAFETCLAKAVAEAIKSTPGTAEILEMHRNK